MHRLAEGGVVANAMDVGLVSVVVMALAAGACAGRRPLLRAYRQRDEPLPLTNARPSPQTDLDFDA